MHRSSRKTLAAKASAGVLLTAAAVVAGPVQSAFAVPAFYTPPESLPAANGTLIRSEPMGLTLISGKATRIMYKSTDTNGNAVAVTGTYIESPKAKPFTGARPLVTFAEGTQGQGDGCAPSFGLEKGISSQGGGTNLGYELPNVGGLLDRGFSVVVTDYIGLGTPGDHTYVNRVDQGHAVLDAARAALQVEGASVNAESPVGAYGYSQGGGAAASAAELAASYAPDVNLKGAYAGAPPADLNQVMNTADGSSLTGVIGYAVNGFLQTYPQLQPILDAETNDAGKAALAAIKNQCIGDSVLAYGFQKTSKWTKSGKTVGQIVAARPEVKAIVDAQKIGNIKPSVPTKIVTGTQDDIVTHAQVKQLAVNWCAKGAKVEYSPSIQVYPTFGTSLNHLTPALTEGTASQEWLSARLQGKAAPSNCAMVKYLP